MEIPDVRYARSGDVAIAYEVVGDGPIRHRLCPGICGRAAVDVGIPLSRLVHRAARDVLTRDHARQARDRSLRPGARRSHARDAHGRPAGRDGCSGVRAGAALDRPGRCAARNAVRGDVSGANSRPVLVRPDCARAARAGLSVGTERRRVAGAARRRARPVGDDRVSAVSSRRVGAYDARGRAVPRLVRIAHAPGGVSRVITAPRSTSPATASLRRSTAPGVRSSARAQSLRSSTRSDSPFVRACTRGSAKSSMERSSALRSTSARGSRQRRAPVRCSSPRRSRTSSPARVSSSRIAAAES